MRYPHHLLAAAVAVVALVAGSGTSEAQPANSAWPMMGGDARRTGQADVLGPKFSGQAPGPNDVRSTTFYDKIKMFPVVGANGTVYVGMGWQFCAIEPLDVSNPSDPVLTQKWCVPTNGDVSASGAVVDKDDYVYFGDRDNSIYKLRGSDGARMWQSYTYQNQTFQLPSPPNFRYNSYANCYEGDHVISPAIGQDGTIYFGFSQNCDGNGSIMAVKNHPSDPTKFNIKWKFAAGQFATFSSPVISTDPSDGKPVIIMGFADANVRAIKDNGTSGSLLWKQLIGVGAITASPVLGPDGMVYVGNYDAMYALHPFSRPQENINGGDIKWKYPVGTNRIDSTAAMGANGRLYFVSRFSNSRTLYSVNPAAVTTQNPQGGLLWTYGPVQASQSPASGFPIIGGDGIVYLGAGNGVYAVHPNTGGLLWQYQSSNGIISSPALGIPMPPALDTSPTQTQQGTAVLYFGSQDRKLYAIKSPRTPLAANVAPVPRAVITPSQSVDAGVPVTFDARTTTDGNGDELFYQWDFGDGTFATGPLVEHTYWSGGTFPVTITVSDGLVDVTLSPAPSMNISGGGLTVFCDNFNRPDSGTLGGPGLNGDSLGFPCPDTTRVWQEENVPPSILTSMSIVGQKLRNDPIKTVHMVTVTPFAGADQVVGANFTSTNNSTAPRFGIMLRFTDPQNYLIAYRWVGGASVLRVAQVVGGVETVLAQTPVSNPAVDVAFRLLASVTTSGGSAALLSVQLCPTTDSCVGGKTAVATINNPPSSGGGVGLHYTWSTSAAPSYITDRFKACVTGPGQSECAGFE
jgi:hypothetical protein